MNENIGVQEEISLSEIFKILLKKIKLLIIVLVVGMITGGVFGALKTYNVHYYGTTIEFYVNPSRSEDKETEQESQYGVYGAYGRQVMESMVELLESESFAETMMLDENGMPEKGISDEIDALIESGDKVAALEAWRETANYQSVISSVSSAISYSYTTNATSSDDTLAKSFINVKISVLNNENLAQNLRERVLVSVPKYVSENMVIPSGYDTTNCQRITRLDAVKLTNPNEMQSTIVKYALLLGMAIFLVTCIAVLVIDYSDKRLKNFERVMDKFKVPVLGVIPTIPQEVSLKKANEKANEEAAK